MAKLLAVDIPQALPAQPVRLALYRNVRDTPRLLERLQDRSLDYAFVDARVILTTTHLLAAIFRAVNDQANHRMKTRNVHYEIVLALNPDNKIKEAWRKFGVQEATTDLIAIKVGGDDDDQIRQQLDGAVDGESVDFNDAHLAQLADLDYIRKVYKLGGSKPQAVPAEPTKGDGMSERQQLEATVIESIALRGAA